MIAFALATAFAADAQYYGTALDTSKLTYDSKATEKALGDKAVTVIWRHDGTEIQVFPKMKGGEKFSALPKAALGSLELALLLGRSEALEFDLLLQGDAGKLVPVTLITGPTWVVEVGTAAPVEGSAAKGAIKDLFRETLATKSFEPGWSDIVLKATKRLSAPEKALFADIDLERLATPPEAMLPANYDGRSRVQLFDPESPTRFVGPVDAPLDAREHAVLYALGLAMNDQPRRQRAGELITREKALAAELASIKADVDAFNASGKGTQADADVLAKRSAEIDQKAQLFQEDQAAMASGWMNPRLTAYTESFSGKSPTAIGEASPADAFAEAFALHHVDPAALDRTVPGANAWFTAGKHLE